MNKNFSCDSYYLFGLQFLAHLSLIPMVMYADWYHWLIAFGVYFITGCFGMTMTYHRLLSHNSWKAPDWFRKLGTFCGMYGMTGSPLGWIAIHRQHHQYADTDKDPHSPHHKKWWEVQFLSMFHKPNIRYIKKLLRAPFLKLCHEYYFDFHLAVMAFWLIVHPFGLIYAYFVPAMILWNMGSAINTVTHFFGYKNHDDVEDYSKNNLLFGFLMWGEGWHENHHKYPNRANFGIKWWEFDIGYFFIKLIGLKSHGPKN